eukprot:Hpha_TRINITY_DN15476_c2_g1::TRINITY_DN15476_c2_g1_i2::g.175754::m.175754
MNDLKVSPLVGLVRQRSSVTVSPKAGKRRCGLLHPFRRPLELTHTPPSTQHTTRVIFVSGAYGTERGAPLLSEWVPLGSVLVVVGVLRGSQASPTALHRALSDLVDLPHRHIVVVPGGADGALLSGVDERQQLLAMYGARLQVLYNSCFVADGIKIGSVAMGWEREPGTAGDADVVVTSAPPLGCAGLDVEGGAQWYWEQRADERLCDDDDDSIADMDPAQSEASSSEAELSAGRRTSIGTTSDASTIFGSSMVTQQPGMPMEGCRWVPFPPSRNEELEHQFLSDAGAGETDWRHLKGPLPGGASARRRVARMRRVPQGQSILHTPTKCVFCSARLNDRRGGHLDRMARAGLCRKCMKIRRGVVSECARCRRLHIGTHIGVPELLDFSQSSQVPLHVFCGAPERSGKCCKLEETHFLNITPFATKFRRAFCVDFRTASRRHPPGEHLLGSKTVVSAALQTKIGKIDVGESTPPEDDLEAPPETPQSSNTLAQSSPRSGRRMLARRPLLRLRSPGKRGSAPMTPLRSPMTPGGRSPFGASPRSAPKTPAFATPTPRASVAPRRASKATVTDMGSTVRSPIEHAEIKWQTEQPEPRDAPPAAPPQCPHCLHQMVRSQASQAPLPRRRVKPGQAVRKGAASRVDCRFNGYDAARLSLPSRHRTAARRHSDPTTHEEGSVVGEKDGSEAGTLGDAALCPKCGFFVSPSPVPPPAGESRQIVDAGTMTRSDAELRRETIGPRPRFSPFVLHSAERSPQRCSVCSPPRYTR